MSPYAVGGGSGGMAELPVGTILDWAGTFDAQHKPDAGEWKECYGSAISQTTYADLYALFGASRWGADGGGNFSLPNFKRRVTVGRDPCTSPGSANCLSLPRMDGVNSGCTGGCESKVLSQYEMPSHQHGYGFCGVSFGMIWYGTSGGGCAANCGYASWYTGTTDGCGSGYGHSTLQPYAVVYKLIKAKKAA